MKDSPTAWFRPWGFRYQPLAWRHRSLRYTEKLTTPDTSVGDLVGDVDPVKVAEGRSLGDPETIHFGLAPRAPRRSTSCRLG